MNPDSTPATAIEEHAGTAVPEPQREPVTVDPRHPLTQPSYPPASIRLGEEATVTFELRIGVDGRVRDSRLLRSSGSARLDAAALEEALRRWRPGTRCGSASGRISAEAGIGGLAAAVRYRGG